MSWLYGLICLLNCANPSTPKVNKFLSIEKFCMQNSSQEEKSSYGAYEEDNQLGGRKFWQEECSTTIEIHVYIAGLQCGLQL